MPFQYIIISQAGSMFYIKKVSVDMVNFSLRNSKTKMSSVFASCHLSACYVFKINFKKERLLRTEVCSCYMASDQRN